MTGSRTFDIAVTRKFHTRGLAWPDSRSAGWFGETDIYRNLACMPWSEARRVLALEAELIDRIEAAQDPAGEETSLHDEIHEQGEGLYGLDIGIASTAIALSAAGGIPFASCNGGAFGGVHREDYPIVAFYARKPTLAILAECAEQAEVGLRNGGLGELMVYGRTIASLQIFARSIIESARRFDEAGATFLEHEIAEPVHSPR